MDAEAFAAESSEPIMQLFRAWLAHTWSQAQILVSDRPAWAPAGMLRTAPGVAAACRAVQESLEGLEAAMLALGAEVPEAWGRDEKEG
jgi:hypothetical protein